MHWGLVLPSRHTAGPGANTIQTMSASVLCPQWSVGLTLSASLTFLWTLAVAPLFPTPASDNVVCAMVFVKTELARLLE